MQHWSIPESSFKKSKADNCEFRSIPVLKNYFDSKMFLLILAQKKIMYYNWKFSKDVSFKKNLKFEEILQVFSEAQVGIHTMKAEHFGIAVVEMIAAGLIVVAHNSAGPKYDIIKEKSDNFGFLCQDFEDYVNSIEFVLGMKE